jgi:hypothetical protein
VSEWFILLIVVAPALFYLLGVWVASESERRAFDRFVNSFDEVTRNPREKTPRVRMTLYRKLVERTRRTQKIAAPPVPEREALNRKFVFLNLKPPPSGQDTVRDLKPPFEEQQDLVSLRIRR